MAAIASDVKMSAEVQELLKKAKGGLFSKGDVQAQFKLGCMFEDGQGVAQDFRQAAEWYRKAAEQGHYDAKREFERLQDFQELLRKAKAGDAVLQFNLGQMLRYGRGIAKNERQAVEWYRKAAEQGFVNAQFHLGVSFASGLGVAKDERQAVEWFRKAAEQGHYDAQYNLGAMFDDGRGVDKDERLAVEWYRRAAEQGYVHAQIKLGWRFERGRGVAKDEQQAVEWYRKAAEQGHYDAKGELERLQSSLSKVNPALASMSASSHLVKMPSPAVLAPLMSSVEDKKRQEEAKISVEVQELLRKARAGDARAQCELGRRFEDGWGVAKDERQAVEWYRKAAEQGDADAKRELKRLQTYLSMVSPDSTFMQVPSPLAKISSPATATPLASEEKISIEVQELLRKAEIGDVQAQAFLGWRLDNGEGIKEDKRKAMEWYRRAANQGDAHSQFWLGHALMHGNGIVQKNEQEAIEWYQKAAKQEHAEAQYNLGLAFEEGLGVSKDLTQARKWYQKAEKQGITEARNALERLLESETVAISRVNSFASTGSDHELSLQARVPMPETTTTEQHELMVSQKQQKASVESPPEKSPHLVSSVEALVLEGKTTQETKLTREQQRFIEDLQKSGLTLNLLEQLQKNLAGSPISTEELRAFEDWKKGVSQRVSEFMQSLSETQQELGLGPDIKAKQDYIKVRPKLEAYRRRLEQEFGYFTLMYCLVPSGLQLEGNKKDAMISAMSSIPQATIEGVPIIGPLLGKVFGLVPEGLKFANKRHRLGQINHIKALFKGGLKEIGKIAYLLSLELTLAKETEIEAYKNIEYKGLAKIKGWYAKGEALAMKQWKDLTTSDMTRVTLEPADELAIIDCAYIMQQISSEETIIDASKELVPQLVEIVFDKPYKPKVLSVTPTAAISSQVAVLVTPASPNPSPLSPVSPTAVASSPPSLTPVSPASLSEIEALKQMLREQQEELKIQKEELRRHQAEAEAAKADTKTLAERLAKVQDKFKPTTVVGGAEALAFAEPETASTTSITITYAEFHALKQQIALVSQTAEQAIERVDGMSMVVYALQDGKKTDRGKAGTKQITHARDLAALETEQKRKEEEAKIAQRAKAKQASVIDVLV